MIDIRQTVFDTVKTAVLAQYPRMQVFDGYVSKPPTFPCCWIMEKDNATVAKSQDGSAGEHHARLMWEVNIFAEPETAYSVFNLVDTTLQGMRFTRNSMLEIPNSTRTLYRLCGRYSAIVSEGVTSGGDTVHYMYRR